MSLQLAVRGLRLATEAITTDDPDLAAIRAGEAVMWAEVAAELTPPGAHHRLSPALSMVRNAVLHGAAVCVGVRDGYVWPAVWPAKWADVVWAPTEVIVDALDRTPGKSKVVDYAQLLAGHAVTDALTDVLAHFRKLN
jgi:hypothetical protein